MSSSLIGGFRVDLIGFIRFAIRQFLLSHGADAYMAWLLFLDESGHDHKTVPYEIHGGVAIHASKLWPFILAVRALEQSLFGTYLHQYGSEFKGSKLLAKDRFKWAQQQPPMDDSVRRKNALGFLDNSSQKRARHDATTSPHSDNPPWPLLRA